jgi:hypothetical protein
MLMVPLVAALAPLPPPLGVTPALPPCPLGREPGAGVDPAEHASAADTAETAASDLRKAGERFTRTSEVHADKRDAVHMMQNLEPNDHSAAARFSLRALVFRSGRFIGESVAQNGHIGS